MADNDPATKKNLSDVDSRILDRIDRLEAAVIDQLTKSLREFQDTILRAFEEAAKENAL
ncbi:MAG TPA: hypothetical protein VKG25_26225 [Bryobacteraceae bacterium]|nr:hypothetical protein [Bryobacteraceae bacterium]